jgi:hypothetical protein
VNRDWAAQQLTDFIAHTTKPVPGTTGQLMQITPGQKHQLAQVVEQILDRVLPDWRGLPNHPGSDGYNKGILMSTDTDLKARTRGHRNPGSRQGHSPRRGRSLVRQRLAASNLDRRQQALLPLAGQGHVRSGVRPDRLLRLGLVLTAYDVSD